ncbi:MAG: hypothetical protein AB7U49_08635 [Hyphomicrobiaceae bacterium]
MPQTFLALVTAEISAVSARDPDVQMASAAAAHIARIKLLIPASIE